MKTKSQAAAATTKQQQQQQQQARQAAAAKTTKRAAARPAGCRSGGSAGRRLRRLGVRRRLGSSSGRLGGSSGRAGGVGVLLSWNMRRRGRYLWHSSSGTDVLQCSSSSSSSSSSSPFLLHSSSAEGLWVRATHHVLLQASVLVRVFLFCAYLFQACGHLSLSNRV
jgi:hypothetical protein